MNERDRLILKQIDAYCDRITERVEKYSVDGDAFIEDDALQDMLLMPVFQIGELANSLSDEYVSSCDGVPWSAIQGFRNIIAHDYGVVDPMWAWNTIETDVPALKQQIQRDLDAADV